jgi:DNA polymerase-3 subunit delta'
MSESIDNPIIQIYPWQESQWQYYKMMRDSDHLPHALLLAGSDGIGKTDFSHILANSLLCEHVNDQGYACGVCKSCMVKKSNAHPDYKFIGLPEGKEQIPVNTIRQLMEFLVLSRSYNGYRVVVIDAADKMNINASNSLLKSLEEPPPKTVIILVANQLNLLPITIRSRCQLLTMSKPNRAVALSWLEQQGLNNSAENMLALADEKPLLAKTLDLDEEFLTQRNKFAKDLLAVLQQRSSVTTIAKDWEKTDLTLLINWQLKWVHAVVKMIMVKEDTAVNQFLVQMQTAVAQTDLWWELHADLLYLKSLTSYPLNRLIFTEAMLLLWRDIGIPQ